MLSEDGLTGLVSLAEGDCPKRSGSLKSEAESADATEEVEDLHVTARHCQGYPRAQLLPSAGCLFRSRSCYEPDKRPTINAPRPINKKYSSPILLSQKVFQALRMDLRPSFLIQNVLHVLCTFAVDLQPGVGNRAPLCRVGQHYWNIEVCV